MKDMKKWQQSSSINKYTTILLFLRASMPYLSVFGFISFYILSNKSLDGLRLVTHVGLVCFSVFSLQQIFFYLKHHEKVYLYTLGLGILLFLIFLVMKLNYT